MMRVKGRRDMSFFRAYMYPEEKESLAPYGRLASFLLLFSRMSKPLKICYSKDVKKHR
jgi:hypothetical protein